MGFNLYCTIITLSLQQSNRQIYILQVLLNWKRCINGGVKDGKFAIGKCFSVSAMVLDLGINMSIKCTSVGAFVGPLLKILYSTLRGIRVK